MKNTNKVIIQNQVIIKIAYAGTLGVSYAFFDTGLSAKHNFGASYCDMNQKQAFEFCLRKKFEVLHDGKYCVTIIDANNFFCYASLVLRKSEDRLVWADSDWFDRMREDLNSPSCNAATV